MEPTWRQAGQQWRKDGRAWVLEDERERFAYVGPFGACGWDAKVFHDAPSGPVKAYRIFSAGSSDENLAAAKTFAENESERGQP